MKNPPWLLAVPGTLEAGRTVVLDPTEAQHLTGALRRRSGDEIVLADGEGWIAEARLLTIGRGRVEAEVLSLHQEPAPVSDGVTVGLAMVSGRSMDWAVQKAVEIGVRRFVPMETERAQIRQGGIGSRIDHWRRISMQALKQCRRPWAMEISDVVPLPTLVDRESTNGGGVVADGEGIAIGELPVDAGSLLVVGPEGGFTAEENELFDRSNWPRLRLGRHLSPM